MTYRHFLHQKTGIASSTRLFKVEEAREQRSNHTFPFKWDHATPSWDAMASRLLVQTEQTGASTLWNNSPKAEHQTAQSQSTLKGDLFFPLQQVSVCRQKKSRNRQRARLPDFQHLQITTVLNIYQGTSQQLKPLRLSLSKPSNDFLCQCHFNHFFLLWQENRM